MPVCVECQQHVDSLYVEYYGAVKLSKCSCKSFADKYIEWDIVLIFIDMALLKPSVYRHMIFNRISYSKYGFNVC
jgi:cytochrome c oxidase subunit IV